jgi:aminoglycoside phosphotransferase (APT) family kinase protein
MTDAPALDAVALGRWMDAEGLPGEGAPTLSRLSGGSQNELFMVDRDGIRAVLRIPPAAAGAARHDGLRRELRLLRALKGAEVPHAEFVAGTDDAGVLGAPFYLMEPVDGWSPMGSGKWPEPFESDMSLRPSLAFELVRGAALLGSVDWEARGLTGFGRPENFHERQVDRWLSFLGGYKFRDLPGLDEAAAWLRTHRPRHWSPGIMHGDYQFANVMYAHEVPAQPPATPAPLALGGTTPLQPPAIPARLAAVIDWEMTTIGDPLLDLGWVLISWPPEGDDMTRYVSLEGMPSRDELLKHYEKICGRPTDDIDYYVVLARWKLGIVLEMSYAKFVSGGAVDPKVASFGTLVLELIRKAAELSRTAAVPGKVI